MSEWTKHDHGMCWLINNNEGGVELYKWLFSEKQAKDVRDTLNGKQDVLQANLTQCQRQLDESEEQERVLDNRAKEMQDEIDRLREFGKIVFAHIYGNLSARCEWRGNHLSRPNIDLIMQIKQALESK